MKLLPILLLLCSFTLSAQNGEELLDDLRYVWAESGLTLRAEGKSGAEKIAVVPYGAEVTITGREGKYVSLPVLKALTINEDLKSKAWAMEDAYLEVAWNGKKGWLYGGYLSRLAVPSNKTISFEEWLTEIGGKPDTVLNNVRLLDLAGRTTLFRYANGITRTESMGESWGSTTVTIPLLSFNDGFLVADKFYWLSKAIEEARNGEGSVDIEPSVLEQIDQGYLLFTDEMSSVEIRRVGNVVVITSEGGC